ncbi:MAG: hypothetical protein Q9168_004402 [Polycauliona sp. 1 TL-2023]
MSARRIRQERGDLSPISVMNGVRDMFDTDSSDDEVQIISPLPPRRRIVSPLPSRGRVISALPSRRRAISPPPLSAKRPRKRAPDTVSLRDVPHFSASKKQKIKAETPNWTMEPRLWEAPDGKSRRIRATTSQLMMQAELSYIPDYVQTP